MNSDHIALVYILFSRMADIAEDVNSLLYVKMCSHHLRGHTPHRNGASSMAYEYGQHVTRLAKQGPSFQ